MSEQMTTTTGSVSDLSYHPGSARMLLAAGVIAGPFYVAVSLAQASTRDGFDLTRHSWSLLANGGFGWVQVTNLVLTGLMTVALAVGLGRTLRPGPAGTWAPRLIGGYGVGLVAAGGFRADPAQGFPPGTPEDAAEVSWHGMLHLVSSGLGFVCLVVACLVVARRFVAQRRRGWAVFSWVTGVLFLAGFAGVAAGAGAAATTLGFVAAVVLAWAWLSAVSADLYRGVARQASA